MARRTRKPKKAKRSSHRAKRRLTGSAVRTSAKARMAAPKIRKSRLTSRKRPTKAQKSPRKKRTPRTDPLLEAAVLEVNRGQSITAAARDSNVTRKQLQTYLTGKRLTKRKGQRWVTKDERPRRVPVITRGRIRIVTVRGYEQARLVGQHHHAVGEFVRTNAIDSITPFDGESVLAVTGRKYPLETNPNALHRIAAMDTPPFHEIYEITSSS